MHTKIKISRFVVLFNYFKVAPFVHGCMNHIVLYYSQVKGTQVHLTTTNTTLKERMYTMSIDNLLDLIIQYKEAAQLIETAQAEQETIKAQIKAEMAQRNTNDLQVGCHKVKLSDFTSTRLDSKAIKAVAPALFTQYSKVVTGQRLTIN